MVNNDKRRENTNRKRKNWDLLPVEDPIFSLVLVKDPDGEKYFLRHKTKFTSCLLCLVE